MLMRATVTAANKKMEDFPFGLATLMSDFWLTEPEYRTGHGLMGMSPKTFLNFASKAGMAGTSQFLFDGRDGRVTFGEFGEGSSPSGWAKVTRMLGTVPTWTVSADRSNLGATLFDTGAQGIWVKQSKFLEYFQQGGWAQGHVHTLADGFFIECDILSKPDIHVPDFMIKLMDDTKGVTPGVWNEFPLDPKWLIGADHGEVDAKGNRLCECMLKIKPPDDLFPWDTELG